MRISCLLLAVLQLCFASSLRGGEALPAGVAGTPIQPVGESPIELFSAKFEIEWGEPARMTGTFELANGLPPADTIFTFAAFSGNAEDPAWANAHEVAVEGRVLTPISTMLTGQNDSGMIAPSWNMYRHVFRRGRTTVTAKALLPIAHGFGAGTRDVLRLNLGGVARWRGSVGEVEVVVRFPGPVTAAEVAGTTPAGFTIAGNTLRWQFRNIEPKAAEFDITVPYRAGASPTR